MLYREIIAVCSEIHTKHTNTLCGQNVELCKVKLGGIYSDHWSTKGQFECQYTTELYINAIRYKIELYFRSVSNICSVK